MKSIMGSSYKTDKKDKPEYTNVIDKATKKPIYGIDECERGREILYIDSLTNGIISPNNTLVAFISCTTESSYERKSIIRSYSTEYVIELRKMINADAEISEEIKEIEQERQQRTKTLIQLGDKIAQIEVFRISELPKYKFFVMPTIKIPEGINIDDCFCGEYAEIRKNEGDAINYKFKYGIANRSKIIIEPNYESVELIGEKYLLAKKEDKYDVIELNTGKKIIEGLENGVEYYDGYITYLSNDYKPFTIYLATNKKYSFWISSELKEINSFSVMNIDEESSVIDKQGNLLIPFYPNMRDGTRNFQFVVKNAQNLWGIVGKQGVSILPFEYEALGSYFSEGLIPAVKNKKLGYVNAKNQIVIPFQYDYKDFFKEKAYFNNEKAQVSLNGKEFYIDKTGKCVQGCN